MFLYFCCETVASSTALRLGPAEPMFRQEPAKQRAVGQQPDPVRRAEFGHPRRRPPVDQRILHLVRDDADAAIGDDGQPLGVEIGQREMADLAFVTQIGEVFQRVEIAAVAIVPPMELQQVEAIRPASAGATPRPRPRRPAGSSARAAAPIW